MRHQTLALLLPALVLFLGTSANGVTFADGQLHVIDAGNSFPYETIYVFAGPGFTATTVTVVEGGQVGLLPRKQPYGDPCCIGIDAADNSLVNIFGGHVSEVILSDTAFGAITGGRIEVALRLRGDSQL